LVTLKLNDVGGGQGEFQKHIRSSVRLTSPEYILFTLIYICCLRWVNNQH